MDLESDILLLLNEPQCGLVKVLRAHRREQLCPVRVSSCNEICHRRHFCPDEAPLKPLKNEMLLLELKDQPR